MKRVKFKSVLRFFEFERDGLKNNTVRVVDYNDERFIALMTPGEVEEIEIEEVLSGETFVRQIKNIVFWNATQGTRHTPLCIITWRA